MKFSPVYRLLLAWIIITLPAAVLAADDAKPVHYPVVSVNLNTLQDSTASRRRPEPKTQERTERPPQETQDGRNRETERRSIKQVPRSAPKLKPQPVGDDIRIQRPPMKLPKGGYGTSRF